MPIQNVGTLLENLVVTEAALALLRFCHDKAPFEFLNSFAMPPLTKWIPNAQKVGFDNATLDRVRAAEESDLPEGATCPSLLRANLRLNRDLGPNGALLVAGVCIQMGIPCRIWLNDVRNGHYGDGIPNLEQLGAQAGEIYGIRHGTEKGLSVHVSGAPYPDSITALGQVLRGWIPKAGARLGFLDPMRYRIQGRESAETSSLDHRQWLSQLAFEGLTCAVHFTGHSDHASLERELHSLHKDAVAEGYTASRVFKRQHYAVFFTSRSSIPSETEEVVAEIEGPILQAWAAWKTFTSANSWQLRIYRNGISAQ